MEGNFQLKKKRKDIVEETNDDFSDFSLSSPATKIRRLDAVSPPIIEEGECEFLKQSQRREQSICSNETGGLKIEELPSLPENEERAIVLFRPIGTAPLLHSPSNFSVSVDPRLVSGLKNQLVRPSQSNTWMLANDEVAMEEDGDSGSGNGCQAVVPWVPLWRPSVYGADFPPQVDNGEMMDADELGEATMDVEFQHRNADGDGAMPLSEGLHQWQQQQHCLIPQPPQNTTTRIFWYR